MQKLQLLDKNMIKELIGTSVCDHVLKIGIAPEFLGQSTDQYMRLIVYCVFLKILRL